jgi:hypothetical protein
MNDRKESKRFASKRSIKADFNPIYLNIVQRFLKDRGFSVRKMDFLPWSKNECDFEADPVLIPKYSMSDRVNPWLENIDSIDYNLDPEC